MTEFQRFADGERAGWAKPDIVAAYIEKFGPVVDAAGSEMVATCNVAGKTVLDLCCGHGNLTAMLSKAGADVTGLDFSTEMLDRAKSALPDTTFVEADAADMPFDAGHFDAVFNNFGMMHIPDPATVLGEVARVLKSGGTFAMATWEAPPRSPAFGTVFGAIKAHADFSMAPPQPDLFAFTEESFAREALAAAGLELTGHDTIQCAWSVSEAADFFDIFLTATVGARMLLTSQSPEVVDTIRDTITARVSENFATDTGYRVPVPVCIVTARST